MFFGGAFYGRGAAEEIFGVAFYEPILCVFDIKVLKVALVWPLAIAKAAVHGVGGDASRVNARARCTCATAVSTRVEC